MLAYAYLVIVTAAMLENDAAWLGVIAIPKVSDSNTLSSSARAPRADPRDAMAMSIYSFDFEISMFSADCYSVSRSGDQAGPAWDDTWSRRRLYIRTEKCSISCSFAKHCIPSTE